MTATIPYYVSRVVLAVALGALLVMTGSPWWAGSLIGALALAWFLWAPYSGRYVVRPDGRAMPLRRDERAESINNKAARNAFVLTMLVLGAVTVYYGISGLAAVPLPVLKGVLILGAVVYVTSDFWLRRGE